MILEIATFNLQSAILAEAAGADRIELCENPADGGTTPSYGTLMLAKEKITIPVFPIIRPRGGDFFYNEDEYAVMKKDIQLCKSLGYEGVVVGLLNEDGNVDVKRTSKFVEIAYPMEVTFHRAFDRACEPFKAMEDIINCGCRRILTSGQVPNAFDGKELIKQLIETAASRIVIMPGSGVRSNNIKEILEYTGTEEIHSSARKNILSTMKFINKNMNDSIMNISVDEEEIKQMKKEITGN